MNIFQIALIFGLFCHQALAFRTAVFAPELKGQVTGFEKQVSFFANESAEDSKRPIWILAGDSLATAFGSGTVLSERISSAETSELPTPGSGVDLPQFRPLAEFTWYAGAKVDKNFLQLIQTNTNRDWVVVATALGGAKTISTEHNPLDLILNVRNPERVELITLSIGGNDFCQNGLTDSDYRRIEKKIEAIKSRFIRAKFLVTKLPELDQVYSDLVQDLGRLPKTVMGVDRASQYCSNSWTVYNCPSLKSRPDTIASEIKKFNSFLEKHFGSLVDLTLQANKDLKSQDLLAGDCFHPSRLAQPYIAKALFESFKK